MNFALFSEHATSVEPCVFDSRDAASESRSIRGAGVKDLAWSGPDGREMTDEAWNDHLIRCRRAPPSSVLGNHVGG